MTTTIVCDYNYITLKLSSPSPQIPHIWTKGDLGLPTGSLTISLRLLKYFLGNVLLEHDGGLPHNHSCYSPGFFAE